jgi:single-stranded-DNA-specific exonuclease
MQPSLIQTQNLSTLPTNVLNPYILQWLEKLGLSTLDYSQITSWDLKLLPPFHQLKDIKKAADRIIDAIRSGEKIGIFGDYDVDGTTSCALLYRFFQKLNYDVKLYQPSRFIEGYGLHPSSIEQAHQDKVTLLITVDCGTSSYAAADRAKELNLDLIVTDHHKDAAPEPLECFALVNPNRRDESSGPMQALAGVGVAFALCICIREKLILENQSVDSLYDLLPYVVVGTISDLAPLNSMNLILCRHGLKAMLQTTDLGLKRFMEKKEINLEYPDCEFISFFIGPMINSKGRLDHPEVALKLLTANQPEEINKNFEILNQTNLQRKKIQQEVFEQAKADVLQELTSNQNLPAIVIYRSNWHEGVIGIVASKLVEEFKRPAIVFTNSDKKGFIKASARTALGIDLFSSLKTHERFFVKFGGHKAAAGLTLEIDQLANFKSSFLAYIQKSLMLINEDEHLEQFIPIDFQDIDGNLLKDIYKLAPFGQGHPMPKWRISGCQMSRYEILKELHIKWLITSSNKNISSNFKKSLTGISFNFFNKNSYDFLNQISNAGQDLTLDAWIKVNQFRGTSQLQLHVDRVYLN